MLTWMQPSNAALLEVKKKWSEQPSTPKKME
jgi:hypothetical protein